MKLNTILPGDSLTLFPKIPTNSIDMTFADPPFNLKKNYNSCRDDLQIKEYLSWCEKWIAQMVRVTKPTGSIFLHNIPKWLTHYSHFLNQIADFKHWISWEAPTAPMGKTLQPAHYGILFYAKDRKQLKFYEVRSPHKRNRKTHLLTKDYGGKKYLLHPFGSLLSDVWTDIHRIKHGKKRDKHPCQLPVHLLERLILMTTDENDTVLDPFMGTGTTAIAAKKLGRNYIGFELDKDYWQIANEKINNTHPNEKLNDCWVSFYLDKAITIRDRDWQAVQNCYYLPPNPQDIDHTPIILKNKANNRFIYPEKNNLFTYAKTKAVKN